MSASRAGYTLLCYFAAVAIAALLGSVVQTQINLAAITALGPEISLAVRLQTTWFDILGFGPVLALLVAPGFILALPLAALLARALPRARAVLFPLAGVLALWAALRTVDAFAPMPTLIAATRTLPGTLAMAACAGVGAWTFHILMRRTVAGSKQ